MGWSVNLVSNKGIEEAVVDEILATTPKELRACYGNMKQGWGWHLGCDVFLPKGNQIMLGGSAWSAPSGDKIIDFLRDELQKRGHTITLDQ